MLSTPEHGELGAQIVCGYEGHPAVALADQLDIELLKISDKCALLGLQERFALGCKLASDEFYFCNQEQKMHLTLNL